MMFTVFTFVLHVSVLIFADQREKSTTGADGLIHFPGIWS